MRWPIVGLLVLAGLSLTACAGSTSSSVPTAAQNLEPPDGAALFKIACAGCHRIEAGGAHDLGPNLHGIVGQAAASRPGYAYSSALSSAELVWDRGSLAAWIAATEVLVPGTTMSYANILTGDEVARVLDYLFENAADP